VDKIPLTLGQFALLWTAVVAVVFGGAIVARRAKGLPVLRPGLPGVELERSWCSGASSTGMLGMFGWANNCLWVAVTRDTLRVGAHFPFNLFLLGSMFGLETSIPLASITKVERKSSFFKGHTVTITYERRDQARATGRTEQLELRPRDATRFADALEERVRLAAR
jgi:hypothetical protein